MSLKIKVINRKTGKELLMDQKLVERANHLFKIPAQSKPKEVKVPKEFIDKSVDESEVKE